MRNYIVRILHANPNADFDMPVCARDKQHAICTAADRLFKCGIWRVSYLGQVTVAP